MATVTAEQIRNDLWAGRLDFNDIASLEHNYPELLEKARKEIQEFMNSSSCK